jgi:hypothetical protein
MVLVEQDDGRRDHRDRPFPVVMMMVVEGRRPLDDRAVPLRRLVVVVVDRVVIITIVVGIVDIVPAVSMVVRLLGDAVVVVPFSVVVERQVSVARPVIVGRIEVAARVSADIVSMSVRVLQAWLVVIVRQTQRSVVMLRSLRGRRRQALDNRVRLRRRNRRKLRRLIRRRRPCTEKSTAGRKNAYGRYCGSDGHPCPSFR